MFKQRIWVWILIILLTYCGNWVINMVITPATQLNIVYNVSETPELAKFREVGFAGIEEKFNLKNPDMIISMDDKEIDGFKKYEEFYFSPLVLYIGDNAREEDSGFYIEETETSLNVYTNASKNLNILLDAVENDKTWQDIGVKENVATGKVILSIPDKNTGYYEYVKELFYLNIGEEITPENYEQIASRVEKIINKCEKVENVANYLNIKSEEDNLGNIALIAPEFYLSQYTGNPFSSSGSSNKKSTFFVPTYFTKTVSLKYNIFIKNDIPEEIKETIIKKYSSNKILTKVGLRPTSNEIDIIKLSYNAKPDIVDVNLSQEIKDLVFNYTTQYEPEDFVNNTIEENEINTSNEESVEKTENDSTVSEENIEETEDESEKWGFMEWFFCIFLIIIAAVIIIFIIWMIVDNFYY